MDACASGPYEYNSCSFTPASIDRQLPQGGDLEQKITVAEVVKAYPMGSAYADY
nr:hypothetical protein [uncultured Undibacterium sp.]